MGDKKAVAVPFLTKGQAILAGIHIRWEMLRYDALNLLFFWVLPLLLKLKNKDRRFIFVRLTVQD